MNVVLLDMGQDEGTPRLAKVIGNRVADWISGRRKVSTGNKVVARWELHQRTLVVVQGQGKLAKVVLTGRSTSSFSDLLHRWEEHSDQNSNDGDDDQQFYECEATRSVQNVLSHNSQ